MSELRLKIYRSPTEFRTETYRQPRVTIGREINNDIVIPDKDVSRFHSLFECDEKGWKIVDLESTNGTYLNGISVKKAPIKSGDVIVVGSTRFHVQDCPAASPFAPVSIAGYRLVQKFDARGVLARKDLDAAEGHAAEEKSAKSKGGIEVVGQPDTRPAHGPQTLKPLAPMLSASEILGSAGNPATLARTFAERLLPLTEADICVVSICDPETDEVKWTMTVPDDETPFVPNEIFDFVRRKRAAVHLQLDQDPGVESRLPRAVISVPILNDRQWMGSLSALRKDSVWRFGDPDLELTAVSGLSIASALRIAFQYRKIEQAYLDLLEATDSLPASVGDLQQSEAEGILLDSSVQKLRLEAERLSEGARNLHGVFQRGEAAEDVLADVNASADRVTEIAESLSRVSRQGRDACGESNPAELLAGLLPLLRELLGHGTTLNERVASELPAVVVAPRVVRAALVRIMQFCRDRMHAVRLTLTAETCGFELAHPVNGHDDLDAGQYVWIAIEAEGDVTAMDDLDGASRDELAVAHDPQSRAMGIYWATRMLRRAEARLIVRSEGDRAIGFDLYLPVLE